MNYKVIERKDPRNPEAPGKYYGFIVNLSKIGIEEIATRISGTCTVTRHDCLAVLSALQEQIIYALQEGKRVHLGDIGSFRTVANGLGSDTAEKYDPAYITKLRVCFTPNTKLKKAMSLDNKAFTLERVDFLPEEEVCVLTGFPPDKRLNPYDPSHMAPLVAAMSRVECGVKPIMSQIKEGWSLYMGTD